MVDEPVSAKLYCRIGEVARLTGLRSSVLRFWETEFPEIAPVKSSTGQRLYSKQIIETILAVKELLYKEKMTIAGARARLGQLKKNTVQSQPTAKDLKQKVIAELLAIKGIFKA